jgi:hypothetical protein
MEECVYIVEKQNGKRIFGTGSGVRGFVRDFFDYDRE